MDVTSFIFCALLSMANLIILLSPKSSIMWQVITDHFVNRLKGDLANHFLCNFSWSLALCWLSRVNDVHRLKFRNDGQLWEEGRCRETLWSSVISGIWPVVPTLWAYPYSCRKAPFPDKNYQGIGHSLCHFTVTTTSSFLLFISWRAPWNMHNSNFASAE